MAKGCVLVFFYVKFNHVPISLVVTNFFAGRADGNYTLKRFDFFKSVTKLDVFFFKFVNQAGLFLFHILSPTDVKEHDNPAGDAAGFIGERCGLDFECLPISIQA